MLKSDFYLSLNENNEWNHSLNIKQINYIRLSRHNGLGLFLTILNQRNRGYTVEQYI